MVFCVDNNSSTHTDNGKKYILILSEKNGLDDTTITVEAKYPVNITKSKQKICFESGLHCIQQISYMLML